MELEKASLGRPDKKNICLVLCVVRYPGRNDSDYVLILFQTTGRRGPQIVPLLKHLRGIMKWVTLM